MKTIRGWIENIEDPELKEKLFANIKKSVLNQPSSSLYNSLSGFTWLRSPEGYEYWSTVAKHIKTTEKILNGKENN